MAICGERAHGHLKRIPRRLTTSRLRVKTDPRSNVWAGTPSDTVLEGLAQYSRRMMSFDSRVQLFRNASDDGDVTGVFSIGFGSESL